MTAALDKIGQQPQATARQMVVQYRQDFATVLPSHLRAETWIRVAQGALKRGKMFDRQHTELEVAATNNPAAFLAAMLDAARLGLEPGTEQFYLTPRRVKGKLEILGIVGWQGYVELMYRAGAVSSVVAEVVRERDTYSYRRGIDEVPVHDYPAFAGEQSRGALKGVYAYARMTNGAVSRVVELGAEDIERIKKSSQGADSEYSPWRQHEAAMWLKSAVRQLAKWVPTSAERVAAVPAQRTDVPPAEPGPALAGGLDEHHVSYDDGETVDAELVDDVSNDQPGSTDWPEVAPIPGVDQ